MKIRELNCTSRYKYVFKRIVAAMLFLTLDAIAAPSADQDNVREIARKVLRTI